MDSEEGEKKAASSKKRPRVEPNEESKFDRDDLVKLWDLVKKRFSTTEPTDDKEKELLYDTCGVHHVSSVRGHGIFMLVKKEYPLTRGTLGLMIVARLLVEADSEMSRELLRKIFYQANRPRQMEQYIHMIDYSLWEVIENGNAPPITKLLKAVEKRFGGNAATKKTRRNLLKKQYENFTTSSLEVLYQTFDRFQKLISQLEIHGESIS
ncbi:hypothetical protein Tco_0026814 [Tanacetum coccineum]